MADPINNQSISVKPNMLSDQVKEQLLEWILEGELAPGSRIVETRIAQQLGVSQAPVREALRDLAALGLVENQAYRGTRVRKPTTQEVIEAMEVRGELEAMAARLVAGKLSDELIKKLNSVLEELCDLTAAGDVHGHSRKNTEFHALIVKASGNKTLQRLWGQLNPFARTYMTSVSLGFDPNTIFDRHNAIIEALVAGDPEHAAETMRHHIKEAEEMLMRGNE